MTYWCEARQQQELQGRSEPLMAGLQVTAQEAYPIPERVCGQMLREMDPECGMEDESYKRVVFDPVYRWRMGRAVAEE